MSITTIRPDEEDHLLAGSACILRVDWTASLRVDDEDGLAPEEPSPWRISERALIAEAWDVVINVFARLCAAGFVSIVYSIDEPVECESREALFRTLATERARMLEESDLEFAPLQAWCVHLRDGGDTIAKVMNSVSHPDDRWAWRAALARDAIHIRVTEDSLSVASHCVNFGRICTLLLAEESLAD